MLPLDTQVERERSTSSLLFKYNKKKSPLLKHPSVVTLGTQTEESESISMNLRVEDIPNDANSSTENVSLSGFSDENSGSDCIYYFGYGPIVNQLVRDRRGFGHIPRENIQAAILYDHRLKFVEGGTANITPSTGWDVKGILIKFNNPDEFHRLHEFDKIYEIKDVSVSPTDETHLDPRNKNDYTAPFEKQQQHSGNFSESRTSSIGYSCPDFQFNHEDVDDGLSEDEEDNNNSMALSISGARRRSTMMYDPTFGANKDMNRDPNAIRAVTFAIPLSRYTFVPAPFSGSADVGTAAEVGMPQERYLKLMAEGLRENNIDETYINDEILQVAYIPNERDAVATRRSGREEEVS